jgi:hypothetical protein
VQEFFLDQLEEKRTLTVCSGSEKLEEDNDELESAKMADTLVQRGAIFKFIVSFPPTPPPTSDTGSARTL